jgi:predicted KAP-like P-loop ATPase
MSEPAVERLREYEKFQILVDDPAEDPRLGFREYADAFAEIVCGSPPRFAIGIFGSWGSGKTTLMQAIKSRIEDREDVIPVWFNAWRSYWD